MNEDQAKSLFIDLTEKAKDARINGNIAAYKTVLAMSMKLAKEFNLDSDFITSTRYL